jgi:hypothetical protein
MNSENRFAHGFLKCEHCGNFAPMETVTKYYRSTKPKYDPEDLDPYDIVSPYDDDDEGWNYELLLCHACQKVTLQEYFYHDRMEPDDIRVNVLYPPRGVKAYYFPHPVRKAYEAAIKARTIDANAYALLLGRTLEAVCEDREVAGKDLYQKLEALAEKGEIPKNLINVAHGLRSMRNIGAHEPFEGLSSKEIPLLDNLSKTILEYIYIAPSLADETEKLLLHLKRKKSQSKKRE